MDVQGRINDFSLMTYSTELRNLKKNLFFCLVCWWNTLTDEQRVRSFHTIICQCIITVYMEAVVTLCTAGAESRDDGVSCTTNKKYVTSNPSSYRTTI